MNIAKNITLNNGVEMPQIGLGTFLIPEEQLDATIAKAYEIGYRQFDTAWRYHNEESIARALKKHNINRDDVFITTKVNIDALYRGGYEGGLKGLMQRPICTIEEAVEDSFKNLNTDYIDLFLVHYPFQNFLKMWKVLEKFYKEGRIRAIGVSSFLPPHLEALSEISDVVPAVNQIEISPLNTQKELISYCNERGIKVEAMSTFSHFRSNEPRLEIINHKEITKIANAHKKSTVQIVLRWMVQQGIIVIPKTWNHDYLYDNFNINDFELSEDEICVIDSLDQGRCLNYNSYIATRGLPIKYKFWKGFSDPKKVPQWRIDRPLWKKVLL